MTNAPQWAISLVFFICEWMKAVFYSWGVASYAAHS
jgi:hypothetical protein